MTAGRIHLCYNGIAPSRFHARRPARGGCPLVIAYLGVLRPEKSLGTLLEAFRQLAPADRALQLRIVGSSPSADTLPQQALARDSARCSFHPFTAEVADVLREVDTFVLPSVSEALSNSLMEAMICGIAVAASRVGGNTELVTHGETGLLFEPGVSADWPSACGFSLPMTPCGNIWAATRQNGSASTSAFAIRPKRWRPFTSSTWQTSPKPTFGALNRRGR